MTHGAGNEFTVKGHCKLGGLASYLGSWTEKNSIFALQEPGYEARVLDMVLCCACMTVPSVGVLVMECLLQSLHDGFDGWLSGCEDQVSTPVRLEGNPAEIARQLKDLKVYSSCDHLVV